MSTRSLSAPLVGRDRQLAVLGGLVGDVVAGRGSAVWVEGEPGIGKSTLLDAALGAVEQHGCQVFRGAAHDLSQRFPLLVLLECLEVSEASQDPLRARIAARLGAPGPEIGAGDPVLPASEGLLALVDRLCAAAPVVLAVDDLQWADDASLAVWDRLARSVGQLQSAAERYRAVGRPLELAATLEDAAVLLAQRGDVDAARAVLEDALNGYADLGADFDVRRTNARLRHFGLRRGSRGTRRRPTTGWDSLTPTELHVAELLAQGGSNPDIAAAMFLSRRTVQTHVSHILMKLGARSRIEIAHQAARHLPARS